MPRSKSPGRSRDRDKYKDERDRDRHSHDRNSRHHSGRTRSRSRDRSYRRERSRSRDKSHRNESGSRGYDETRHSRSDSRDRNRAAYDRQHKDSRSDRDGYSERSRSPAYEPKHPSSDPAAGGTGKPAKDDAAEAKRRRLEAWKAKQQQKQDQPAKPTAAEAAPATSAAAADGAADAAAAAAGSAAVWMPWEHADATASGEVDLKQGVAEVNGSNAGVDKAADVWMPWDDPSVAVAGASTAVPDGAPSNKPSQHTTRTAAAFASTLDDDDEIDAAQPSGIAAAAAVAAGSKASLIPAAIAARKAKAAAEDMADMLKKAAGGGDEEDDPLDAFMSAEIMPEVAATEAAERATREAERIRLAKLMAEGKGPKLPAVLDEDSDEEVPDVEIQVPTSRVKLIVGPGGAKIKEIQKKSSARLQIKKEEAELNRAFGAGLKAQLTKPDSEEAGQKLTTIQLFGDSKAVEIAMRMIDEAIDNREQKQKQRQKEYERKREVKRRERQLYHLRHARDYEALGLPMGASKIDVKKAYRKLAVQWHPDKHPDNQEEAKAKFQEISAAYTSLMTTNEDEKVEQIESKA